MMRDSDHPVRDRGARSRGVTFPLWRPQRQGSETETDEAQSRTRTDAPRQVRGFRPGALPAGSVEDPEAPVVRGNGSAERATAAAGETEGFGADPGMVVANHRCASRTEVKARMGMCDEIAVMLMRDSLSASSVPTTYAIRSRFSRLSQLQAASRTSADGCSVCPRASISRRRTWAASKCARTMPKYSDTSCGVARTPRAIANT